MPQIEITDLRRCAGGNHYHATVAIDGGKPTEIAFTSSEIEDSAKAVRLKDVVLFLVGKDLAAINKDGKATVEEEKLAVIGKSIDAEIFDEQKVSDVKVREETIVDRK